MVANEMANSYYNKQRTRTRNQLRRRKFIEQKLIGLALLAMSALVLHMAHTGVTIQDRDGTALLITVPMGLYLLFTRHIVIV